MRPSPLTDQLLLQRVSMAPCKASLDLYTLESVSLARYLVEIFLAKGLSSFNSFI